jgi:hypothetical protein
MTAEQPEPLEDKIYEILYRHEGDLSDGYGYYGGEKDVLLISKEIADLLKSRPHTQAPDEITWEMMECAMDRAAKKAARDVTLAAYDKIILWASQYQNKKFTAGMLGEYIASLRQSTTAQEDRR